MRYQYPLKGKTMATERTEAWIGVDLDGTVAYYRGWEGVTHIGDPIPIMVDRIRQKRMEGIKVKIFTARVCMDNEGHTVEQIRKMIEDWTEKHIGERLEVTNVKDFGMVELWDDRAIQVETNTGKMIYGTY